MTLALLLEPAPALQPADPPSALDWSRIVRDRDEQGAAVVERPLSAEAGAALAAPHAEPGHFRSHVSMARHDCGRGECRYAAEPLPEPAASLRRTLYPPPAAIANGRCVTGRRCAIPRRMPSSSGSAMRPARPARRRSSCSTARGDHDCLHHDLYGDLAFPIQMAILLAEPGRDFTGEFVLTEQHPRTQGRAELAPLRQGDAVAFVVRHRPADGTRSGRPRAARARHHLP